MFYGWWIVVITFFAGAFGGAVIWYGFTAFFDPLVKEFAWSYTAISLAASLRSVETGIMDAAVGFLADRFGGRRIVFAGLILVGIGYLMLSRISSLSTFYISFIIIFIGGTGIGNVVIFQIITRWFRKRLGLALGIASAGYGVGGFAVPGIVYLLDVLDFREVFVIIGIAALVAGCFIVYFLRSRPEDTGTLPDGVSLSESEPFPDPSSPGSTGITTYAREYSIKETLRTPAFWIITYVSTVSIFSMAMIVTHVMPYLEHLGYARYAASIVAMMIPVTSILGRLGVGWVSDFFSRKTIFILAAVAQAAGVWLFIYADISMSLAVSVILFGISYGGIIVLRPGALRDYYGSTHIGTIIGFCLGVTAIGSMFGPLLAGWVFDTTDSYRFAWVISGVLLVVGIPLMLLMKNPTVAEKHG